MPIVKNTSLLFCVLACFVAGAHAQVSSGAIPSVSWFDLPLPAYEMSDHDCTNAISKADAALRNSPFPPRKSQVETETKQTTEMANFFDTKSSKTFSAFLVGGVKEHLLTLRFVSKEIFQEYRGPVVNTVNKTIYGPSPHLIAGTALSLGLLVPFNLIPHFRRATFGCTDETVVKSQIDGAKSTPTGIVMWKDTTSNQNIVVSGFAKDYEYDVKVSNLTNPAGLVTVDLTSAIDEALVDGVTTLVVVCKTCDEVGDAEKKEFSIPPINAPINFDFRPIKEAMRLASEKVALARKVETDKRAEEQRLSDDEGNRLEEDRRQMEVERIKRIADEAREAKRVVAGQAVEERKKKEEAARVARNPQPLPNEVTGDSRLSLDITRKKCVDLGFKPGKESFGKCLLQLSK